MRTLLTDKGKEVITDLLRLEVQKFLAVDAYEINSAIRKYSEVRLAFRFSLPVHEYYTYEAEDRKNQEPAADRCGPEKEAGK